MIRRIPTNTSIILAFGCNISAFFSGFTSTSLNVWLWLAAVLAGA